MENDKYYKYVTNYFAERDNYYKNVIKYFPNLYDAIVKKFATKNGAYFLAYKEIDIKSFLYYEGLYQLLEYLDDNLQKDKELLQKIEDFRDRLLDTPLNSSKPYLKFTDGYIYDNKICDDKFELDMITESSVLFSSIKMYFEIEYNSENYAILGLQSVYEALENVIDTYDKEDSNMTSYEYIELALLKNIYEEISNYIVEFAYKNGYGSNQ